MQMKKIFIFFILFTSLLLATTWYAGAFSMDSEGIISPSGISGSTTSDFGYSSDTLVMTGGSSSKPVASPTQAGGTSSIPKGETIPSQWKPGTRSGTFLDPITQTNWFFDNVLQKFYSPNYGWFLVTQYTSNGKVYAQFYYDPKAGVFLDMSNGNVISGTTGSPGPSGQGVNPAGSSGIAPSGSTPVIAAQTPTQKVTSGTSTTHPCRIVCNDCPSGYCDDCNQNGKCDDQEESVASGNNNGNSGSISDESQTPIQTQATLLPSSSTIPPVDAGLNEEGQAPVQYTPTITPIPTPSIGISADAGLSEDPQATIYYDISLPISGKYPIINCDSSQDCKYCLDTDEDGKCTGLDYAFLLCGSEWGLDYMGLKDGICDENVLLLMECSFPSKCQFAEICMDVNGDGVCDESGGDLEKL